MGTKGRGRRGALRLVKPRPRVPLYGEGVVRADLADGVVGRWLRYRGGGEVQVSEDVPDALVLSAAQHVMSHGSLDLADALGMLSCEVGACPVAPAWLNRRMRPAAASDC